MTKNIILNTILENAQNWLAVLDSNSSACKFEKFRIYLLFSFVIKSNRNSSFSYFLEFIIIFASLTHAQKGELGVFPSILEFFSNFWKLRTNFILDCFSLDTKENSQLFPMKQINLKRYFALLKIIYDFG